MKAEAFLARLAGTQERLKSDLRVVLQRLAIKVQGAVKGSKLTGQVLHVRTGTLRRSINQKLFETDTGVYAQVGTNVATRPCTSTASAGSSTSAPACAKAIRCARMTARVNLPKRSFLVSTLQEMHGEIQTSLRATMLKAVRP
jgi:hypothetical protein